MSLHEYRRASAIRSQGEPFYALVMAAMWGADTQNAQVLRDAFPETWEELQARYDAPGGFLEGERT